MSLGRGVRSTKQSLWVAAFTLVGYYNAGALSRDIMYTCAVKDFLN
jgi:hypothetical protein